MWLEVVASLVNVNLTDTKDVWEWKPGSKAVFSVKAMYNDVMLAEYEREVSPIWKLKVPLKIKVFL